MPVPPSRQIQHHMTKALVVVTPTATVEAAAKLMRRHTVRHLPVVDGKGKLVGIVSQRDLLLVQSIPGVNAAEVAVSEAMNKDVYRVQPDEAVEKVARTMAGKRYGACVVANRDQLLGLFTTTDAMNLLAHHFEKLERQRLSRLKRGA
jgi:acetoin utilization protein AcuB